MTLDTDVLARLGAAVVLGAAVGFEREASDQPAGLRTHITVAIGACLFGVISTLGFSEFEAVRETTNVQVDVTRVASQVVVGIGFLGAGMIFRQGGAVKNLTTAASLWVTSAIGLAAGVGDIGSAAIATAAVLVSLVLLRPARGWIRRFIARDDRTVRITLVHGIDSGALVGALTGLDGVDIANLAFERDKGAAVVVAQLRSAPHVDLDQRLATIASREDVDSLSSA